MDWSKAKTYIAILLFVINLMLFIFNFIKSQDYYIDINTVKTVQNVLEKKGVQIKCNMPLDYFPMRNMELKPSRYDYVVLKSIFFDKLDSVSQTAEFGENIMYSDDGRKLRITSDKVIFEGSINKDDIEKNLKEYSDEIIKDIVKSVEKNYCVMKKLRNDISENGYNVVYSQQYNGYFIFNNSLSFKFEPDGSYTIEFKYNEPIDFTGPQNEIYSSSEILYNFSSEVNKIYDMNEYVITDTEIGYYYENNNIIRESSCVCRPFYRIYVEGIDEPFFVSACDNGFLYEG